jgi:hypothetical protein
LQYARLDRYKKWLVFLPKANLNTTTLIGGDMSEPTQVKWRIAGEELASCNCDWGCPCQFNALPTTGRCEAFVTCLISNGYFGSIRLDGVVFSRIYWWPRAIHEGNGVRRMIIDEQATKEQCDALIAIESGQHGGLIWEISVSVAPNPLEPLFAPITFKVDREKRRATVRIPGIGETNVEPIKNPVTGEEHRARIVLPYGFEYKEAEMGNTVYCRVGAGERLAFELKNTYGN